MMGQVLGAVKTPRAVPYRDRMSLVSAISGADSSVRYDWFSRGEGIFKFAINVEVNN